MPWTGTITAVNRQPTRINVTAEITDGTQTVTTQFAVATVDDVNRQMAAMIATAERTDVEAAKIVVGPWTPPVATAAWWPALAAEIAGDPATYSALTDAQVADVLNARNLRGVVTTQNVKRLLMPGGVYAGIVDAGRNNASADVRKAALALTTFLDNAEFREADFSDANHYANISAQLDALVTTGLITTDHKAAILALGENQRTRAEALGLPPVTEADVTGAKAL